MNYSETYPIFSRRNTVLIVNEPHTDVMHSGLEATLSKTRSRYWLVRGRQTIKGILKK